MSVIEAMMVPMVLFLVIVAPLWLLLHYLAKRRETRQLSQDERNALEQMSRVAEKMEARIAALEKILSSDDPGWKDKVS